MVPPYVLTAATTCNICQQPILDEAIMTGDDSYHAHCFKCKVCRNRIDELVFAKTTHGIYCMNCHNERMAKIRRHAQRKREKEKATAPTIPSSARDPLQDNSVISPPSSLRSHSSAHVLRDAPSSQSLHVTLRDAPSSPARHPRSPSPADLSPPSTSAVQSTVTTPTERQHDSQTQSSEQSQSFVMTIAPPDTNFGSSQLPISLNGNSRKSNGHDTSAGQLQSAPAHLTASNSHLSPTSAIDGMTAIQRRKSYDDGVRPLNVLFANHGANQDNQDVVDKLSVGALNVPAPTSRADRRRSINPGLALQFNDTAPNSAPPDMIRSQTLPARSDSPASSPSNPYFDHSIVRRSSNTSLLRDNASGSTILPLARFLPCNA
ncbi:hypothetical protein JVT61DRAFT_3105 [Boletus reticuloceps]|uniref:LIM zinc-binding domain-containing protein n=1 Tax=Boletus reticuloceps TaxID=495285 RepID=A0A8I2YMU9_9AGAM|nr:hypothetical protein JVT61DRAFT_3105 [Boletus reticuloceps]